MNTLVEIAAIVALFPLCFSLARRVWLPWRIRRDGAKLRKLRVRHEVLKTRLDLMAEALVELRSTMNANASTQKLRIEMNGYVQEEPKPRQRRPFDTAVG